MSSSWWTNIRARRLTNVVPQLRRQEKPFPRPISLNFSFISIPIKIGGKLQDFCILATSKSRSICHFLTDLPFLRVYRYHSLEETISQARRAQRFLFSNNCVLGNVTLQWVTNDHLLVLTNYKISAPATTLLCQVCAGRG